MRKLRLLSAVVLLGVAAFGVTACYLLPVPIWKIISKGMPISISRGERIFELPGRVFGILLIVISAIALLIGAWLLATAFHKDDEER
jgi:hypothetical protein